ncbi:MAG: AhpC/TSA family protein [Gemmatimonadaceae bacterium]|nr:AhpC/TSA family protein [Gemmatimonadaceae bacterium]
MAASDGTRLQVGARIPPRTLTSITGERISVPDARGLVHLQFRRFAGCPVCNLHLHSYAQRHAEIVAAGVREVVLFHSSARQLRRYASDLPFTIVGDPGKQLYREFGVEASLRALLHPRAVLPIVRAVAHSMGEILRGARPMPPLLRPEGGRFGLPADFLVDRDGVIRACHYGAHVDDQWSVDEMLERAAEARERPQSARVATGG